MSGKTKVLMTAALTAAVFIAVSAVTIIVVSRWSVGPTTAAVDHGLAPGPVPTWVNPYCTIDIDKVPERK